MFTVRKLNPYRNYCYLLLYHYKIILKNTTEFPKVSKISLSREKTNMADDECVVILNTLDSFWTEKEKRYGSVVDSCAVCYSCHSIIKCAGGGTSNLMAHLPYLPTF